MAAYEEPEVLAEPVSLPLTRPAPSPADADAVLEMLTRASRPVILAGTGVHHSRAYDCLRAVAERLGIPVATSSGGKGSIAETHDLALGTVGRYSRKYANDAIRNADVVLALGTQLGGLVTDSYRLISPDAQLVHVTLDPEVIGLNFKPKLGLAADARAFLEAIMAASDRRAVHASDAAAENLEALREARRAWQERRAELAGRDGNDGGPMRPEAVLAAIDEMAAPDAIIVADTGYSAAWGGALAEVKEAGRQLHPRRWLAGLGVPGGTWGPVRRTGPPGRVHHRRRRHRLPHCRHRDCPAP